MRRAASAAAYAAAPVGGWIGGRHWLVFCASPLLSGLVVWDDPSDADARAVLEAMEAEVGPGLGAHAFFVDARRLCEQPDPHAFAAVVEHLAPRWEQFGARITRNAIVLPPGMGGAVVAGFHSLLPAPFPP